MSCKCKKKCDKTCLCASNNGLCTSNEAPVITVTTKCHLMKPMMIRVMVVLVNTVTNLILNTEPFPFFDFDAIFFIHDTWEQYFLTFLRISSILDFSNFMAPEMESDESWRRRNELGSKAFCGSLIHSLSLHSKQISLKIILIKFFKIFCLKFRKIVKNDKKIAKKAETLRWFLTIRINFL